MNKLATVLVLLLCISHSYAQYVSLDTNIKENDKEWPVCSRPTHVETEISDGYTMVSWDATDDPSDYEVKLVHEQTRAVMLEATVSTNYIALDENVISKNKEYFVKVRRKCRDKQNNTIYSDWVVQAIANSNIPCNCDELINFEADVNYKIEGECLLIKFDDFPCSNINPEAHYRVQVHSIEPEYPQTYILGPNLYTQISIGDITIDSILYEWIPNGSNGCGLQGNVIPYYDFEPDTNLFDLTYCHVTNPCSLAQFITANQLGNNIELNISGISQSDFDTEMSNVSTAHLLVSGWSSTGYVEYQIPYYNENNNTDIFNWLGTLTQFNGASTINIQMVYTDTNGNVTTCTEEYTIPVSADSPYCDILQLLLPEKIDTQSLKLSFGDSTYQSYILAELNALGLNYPQANNLFRNNIKEIRYKLLNTNQIIYVTNIAQLPLIQYSTTFNPVQIDENFTGTVEIEYIFYDYSSEFCYISPIVFEQEEEEEEPENELPEYECGSSHDAPNITNQNLLDVLFVGDLVEISGISFIIESVAGTNGNYSGTGRLANPFTDKPIAITYHSLSINDEYQSLAGEVNGEIGDPANYTDFYVEPDTFNIGGEICLPPPPPPNYDQEGFNSVTGLNDRGFSQDSIHSETNSIYDPKGFDIEGNHVDTGETYDLNGCDMNGYDEAGELCEKDPTVIKEFIDSINQTIVTDVTLIVDNLLDSLDLALGNDCSSLRSEVSALIDTLEFDSKYIVGENNEYLNAGMSENFISEPHPLVLNTERDPKVTLLENKHVDLYHCDKNYTKISQLLTAIQSVSTEEIIALVKEEVQYLTNYQVDQFKSNPEDFQAWIIFTIEKLLKENYGISHFDRYQEKVSPTNESIIHHKNKRPNSDYYATASLTDITYGENTSVQRENYWLFGQGRQEINGVDRGLYLEELYNQMLNDTPKPLAYLPLRIRKEIDNTNYDIYLDRLRITPAGASVDATFIYTEPNSSRKLIFKAQDLAFGKGGIIGESKLSLQSFIELRLTNAAMLRINPGDETFVTWNCTGFTGMGINADVELCRNLVIPLHPNTYDPLPDPIRYQVNFSTTINSWSDLYIEINDSNINRPFAMADYPNMIWNVQDIAFDFSDHRSPTQVMLNPAYTSPHVNGSAFLPSWKGVHFGWIEVQMESDFSSDGQPMRIGASDIIIDDTGVSGLLYGDNVLPYEDGNASGWQISVNSIDISVLQNHINGGSLGGKIGVPVFKDPMDYNATILQGGHYDFVIRPNVLDSLDIYGAEVKLDSNSYVQAKKYSNEGFEFKATLHGTVSIDKELAGVELKYNDIRFDNFEVSNLSPYFSAGNWHFPNSIGADLYGFGINLTNINQFQNPNDVKEVGMSTIVDLNLAEALGIKAAGGISIIGKMHEDQLGRQKWRYDRLEMDQFAVDAQFSAGHIKGSLSKFENNNTYGKGFQGFLEAEFKGLGKMTAMGLFGNTGIGNSNYKYFFVDALVSLDGAGIPAGPLSINGFAGGASYHMDRDHSISNLNSVVNTGTIPPVGSSFSGTVYSPNKERGLGLKAGALISTTGTESLFNGLVSFGVLFNEADTNGSGGGIEEIDFNGMGQFLSLSPINSTGENQDTSGENQDTTAAPNISSSLTAYIDLNYNFSDNIFDGIFNCFLNTPGDFIKGGMDQNGKMVDATAYFGPNKWYIYLGTPNAPCEIALKVPGVNINAKVQSYLDVGTDVPNMKPLPSNVREIAYKVNDNKSIRSSGAGFVFGSRFLLDAHLNFGIASGELNAGVGFDLMVRNYPGAYCLGNHASEEIGINGWYGMGQMWAYVEGKVKIFGVSVLEAGIAAVLQAQLPNPTFAQATVGVKFRVLFKNYTKSLNISIGEQCTIINEESDSEIGMKVIQYMDPVSDTKEIEPDASVRVITSIPLNEIIELPTLNSSTTHNFKVEIEEMRMYGKYGDYLINPSISQSGTEIIFGNSDQFIAHDSITAIVVLSILKDGQEIGTESDTTSFTVGNAYNFIPETNVSSAYPMDGMSNFYKKEYNKKEGYIILKQGMPELFYEDEKDVFIKLVSDEGDEYVLDLKYHPLEKKITFELDPNILTNGRLYKLTIVKVKSGNYETHNVERATNLNSFMSNNDDSSKGDINEVKSNELYSITFRVSLFSTFENKIKTVLELNNGKFFRVNQEVFDDYEIEGTSEISNLITLKTNFSSFFKKKIENLYDQNYPINQLDVSTTGSQLWLPLFCSNKIGNGFDTSLEVISNAVGFEGTSQSTIFEDDFNGYKYDLVGTQNQRLKLEVGTLVNNHWQEIKSDIMDCLGNLDDLYDDFGGNSAFGVLDGGSSNNSGDLGEIELVNDGLEYIYQNSAPTLSTSDKNITINYTTPGGIHTSSFKIQF